LSSNLSKRGRESERTRVEAAVLYPSPLLVTVEESDATLHVRLAGEFDLAAVPLVERALNRLSRAPLLRRLVLDLTAVSFLDLAGLRTILRADARGRAEAFEVLVVRPRGTANRIFTLTRVGEELRMVHEPEAQA
jgi:anti-anti-sigma factor